MSFERALFPGSGELEPSKDIDKVNLEHVLPKTYTKELGISRPEHDDLLMRLGNQTIMQSEWNRDLGNLTFSEKVGVYARSEIGLTKELADFEKFTRSEVDARQANMAVAAPDIWSLKFA